MAAATAEDVIARAAQLRDFAAGRFASREDMEDAVQQALAEALTDLSFIERNQLWRRLKELVKSYALNAKRRETRAFEGLPEESQLSAPYQDTPEAHDRRELLGHWRREALEAVAELPEDLRQVFTLVSLEGEKVEVVARKLKTSPAQISRKNHAAASTLFGRLLRKGLERRDFFVLGPLFALIDWVRSKPKTAMASGVTLAALITFSFVLANDDAAAENEEGSSTLVANAEDAVPDQNKGADRRVDASSAEGNSTNSPSTSDDTSAEAAASTRYREDGLPSKKDNPSLYQFTLGPPAPKIEHLEIAVDHDDLTYRYPPKRGSDPVEWAIPKVLKGEHTGENHGVGRRFDRGGTLLSEIICEYDLTVQSRNYDSQGRLVYVDNWLDGPSYSYTYVDGVQKEQMHKRKGGPIISKGSSRKVRNESHFNPLPLAAVPTTLHTLPAINLDLKRPLSTERYLEAANKHFAEDDLYPIGETYFFEWDQEKFWYKNAQYWELIGYKRDEAGKKIRHGYTIQFKQDGYVSRVLEFEKGQTFYSNMYRYHFFVADREARVDWLYTRRESEGKPTLLQYVVVDH